ncbi:MAG: hypothetical protein JKY53_10565 [Flavobacteriales bacterium]|nr:hypothetical protein [Flavobacteriales bacterium]
MVNYIGDRISFSEADEELTIVISGKVESWQESLLAIWLAAWTFCGLYVLTQLFGEYTKEERLIMFVYEVFWVYFEWKLVHSFLWRKWGAEVIKIGKESIRIKNDIKKYGKVKTYFVENIDKLQRIEASTKSFSRVMGNSFWNTTEKAISFDYLGKIVVLGIQLDEKDAKKVTKLIAAHLRKMA